MLRETDTDVLFAVQKAIQDLDGVETGVDGVPSMNADEDRDNERKLREERLIASMEDQVRLLSFLLWARRHGQVDRMLDTLL